MNYKHFFIQTRYKCRCGQGKYIGKHRFIRPNDRGQQHLIQVRCLGCGRFKFESNMGKYDEYMGNIQWINPENKHMVGKAWKKERKKIIKKQKSLL